MSLVFINNSFIDEIEAVIQISDRGFRFGDGVFETVSFYDGAIYQKNKHKSRMKNGLNILKIEADIDEIFDNANMLIKLNKLTDGGLRISVTRGNKSLGYLPAKSCQANVIIETSLPRKKPTSPIVLWVCTWQKPSLKSLPVNIKTMQGLNSVLARMEAEENSCDEALLLNADGEICECSSSNIFWFKDDILYTPALECGILNGTIRDAVISLSPYKVEQGRYNLSDLKSADEVFITNVNLPVFPVAGLKPKITAWNSHNKTSEIQQLIEEDIAAYAANKVA